jgi:hypothetical protein
VSDTPAREPQSRPALEHMGLAVEALATGAGAIHARLQAAEPHFGRAFQCEMSTDAQEHLRLRIGAGLVEGGDDAPDDADASEAEVAESISLLSEQRAVELAGDMVHLYELLVGLRTDDGYRL